ncbi:MAG: hypothetical protein ACEQR5_00365 [Moraxellaceae bacterium]|jgi:uncharacterized membrane protein
MNWTAFFGIFSLAMVKFMFAPFGGPTLGLSALETYAAAVSGAIVCAVFFYFASEYFLKLAVKKHKAKLQAAQLSGIPMKTKKKFTRMNKFIVRIKHRLGIVGLSFFAPFFLGIPLGTIIAAKFFGHQKKTFPLILAGILFNGAVTTSIRYGLAFLFE